jgi:hypothetical protein
MNPTSRFEDETPWPPVLTSASTSPEQHHKLNDLYKNLLPNLVV